MIVYCLGFGWLLPLLLPDRYFVEAPIIPIAILAAASLVLALLTSCYFISPVEFPRKQALSSLFFTMIIGISLLLAFQTLTIAMSDHKFQGPTKFRLFMGVFQLIGEAYKSLHSESIIGQFFGNILGVGLCEEFTKLLPLFFITFWSCSDVKLCFRKFLMVGFFSGLGFGIGEALFVYAPWGGNFSTNDNIIRWFACVPSHAIYTVIDAACLWYLIPKLRKTKGDSKFLGICASATFAVAVIHGVYDVLHQLPYIGLVLDGASMALMFWLVNKVARKRRQGNMVGHSEGAEQRGVMSFVRRCENDGWKFALIFMFAGFMILLSLKFSISIRTGGVYLRIFKNAGNYEIKNGGAWGAYCLELTEDRSAHFMFYSGEDNHPTAIIRSFRARSGPNVYSGNYALGGEEQQKYLLEGEKLHHLTANLWPLREKTNQMILTGRSQGDTLTLRFISPGDAIGEPFSPSNWDSNKLEIHGFKFKFYSY